MVNEASLGSSSSSFSPIFPFSSLFSKNHRTYYREFEGEIKVWLGENWSGWHETRPKFLEALLKRIPIDLIPGSNIVSELAVADRLQMARRREERSALKRSVGRVLGLEKAIADAVVSELQKDR